MSISGALFIGYRRIDAQQSFKAVNPVTGASLEPAFSSARPEHIELACKLAASAFDSYRNIDLECRARFLEKIGANIMAIGDELLERTAAESALPAARLAGERARTVNQLKLFADEVRAGGWLGVRIDPAMPDRKPLPRSDLRQRKIPLGPVAVFGASNFPLAFSVAGGDTASALAAGCPVVVKGHPAHPGTSELVAQAIIAAARECDLPEGVFSLLNGIDNALGATLVSDPRIKAVGFTGSRSGGLALRKIAQSRAEPIPIYAEMSSINPVFLLPQALKKRTETLGRDFVASLTLGAGQFCTNPGLVVALRGPDLDRFVESASASLKQLTPTTMLTPGIGTAFRDGVARVSEQANVVAIARGADAVSCNSYPAAFFSTSAADFLTNSALGHEVFGASSLLVNCEDELQMLGVIERAEGQLTATLHLEPADEPLAQRLMPALERKAGRILVNGWPTGVEVTHSMVHGGPFPATSDSRTTSVGTLAIERFLRPVCYQDVPDALLPSYLRRDAQLNIPNRFDGEYRSK